MNTTANAASARAPTSGTAAFRRKSISRIAAVQRPQKLNAGFDPEVFLAKAGVGKTIVELATNECAFSQGEPADSIFYIQKGRVTLTVVSHQGKEATIAMLGAGEFLGENCVVSDHPTRMATATAITP